MKKKSIFLRLYEWNPVGPGKFLDAFTYWGCIRGLITAFTFVYLTWNFYEIMALWDSLWGVESHIDPGKQGWTRIWSIIIGGTGIAGSILGMIMIRINRRRARESAAGQWYNRPNLTREEMQSDETRHEERDREQP